MICYLQLRTTFKPEALRARAWGINLNLQAGDACPGPSREAIEARATVFCLFVLVSLSVGWRMSIHTNRAFTWPVHWFRHEFHITNPYRCTQSPSDKQPGTDWTIQSLLPHILILKRFWDTPRGVPPPTSSFPTATSLHRSPSAYSQLPGLSWPQGCTKLFSFLSASWQFHK